MKTDFTRLFSHTLLLIALFGVASCQKTATPEDDGGEVFGIEGGIPLRITVGGLEAKVEGNGSSNGEQSNTSGGRALVTEEVQRQEIRINDDLTVVAELVPEQIQSSRAVGSGDSRAATTPVTTTLPDGTQYRLQIFHSDGSPIPGVDGQTFTVDSNNPAPKTFNLPGTGTYYVLTYGYIGGKALSTVTGTNLNDLVAEGLDSHFGYSVEEVQISGPHSLNVKLKNVFSEIVTTLDVTEFGSGVYDPAPNPNGPVVYNAKFTGANHASADVPMGPTKTNDDIIYNGSANDVDVASSFSVIAPGSVARATTALIHEATTAVTFEAEYTLGTAGTQFYTLIHVPDISVTPGVRYNLNLTMKRSWRRQDGATTPGGSVGLSYPSQTWRGFDHVFSGGRQVMTEFFTNPNAKTLELVVTSRLTSGDEVNVLFRRVSDNSIVHELGTVKFDSSTPFFDGSYYGDGTIPALNVAPWGDGNARTRILIDRATGNVMLYGRKAPSTSIEYPMMKDGSMLFTTLNFLDQIAVDPSDWEMYIDATSASPATSGFGMNVVFAQP